MDMIAELRCCVAVYYLLGLLYRPLKSCQGSVTLPTGQGYYNIYSPFSVAVNYLAI